jgi:hypothetical protein
MEDTLMEDMRSQSNSMAVRNPMNAENESKRPSIVTTSWDDGHPLDLRLAELMVKHGIRGTFYVPASNGKSLLGKSVLDARGVRELSATDIEVGSHSLTHANLIKCPDPLRELSVSKERLEQILSRPIQSFCYPGGAFNYRISRLARTADYKLARTTVAFRTAYDFDPFRMPVTLKFHSRSRTIHLCQLAKSANLSGLLNWSSHWAMKVRLENLIGQIIADVSKRGGIFHLWGHSWEIDSMGLWERLGKVFEYMGNRPELHYLTNLEAMELIAC